MEKKKLLSISLLVSDRPDTIEKCLNSLEHLRKSVPSELILVDTGCGEKVRKMIEPYADKIVEFVWCKDFAKARNAGLKEATGEWFLYLDDDEWFEDTSEIEDFFLKGEWKNYGYAIYKVRNYSDFSGKRYDDVFVTRMVRLRENTQFIYSIHETFNELYGKVKKFNAYVHHYGYAYKSKKDFFIHSQRNIVPLLEEHKRNPQELRHNVQLAQEYNVTQEYRKSIEISIEGIKRSDVNLRYLNALFANIVNCYCNLYDYQKALEYGKKFLKDNRINELCAAAIHSTLCRANYELHNYKETLEDLQKYLQAYQKQQQNENYYLLFTILFLNCFEEREVNYNIGFGIKAALALDDAEKAKHLFDKIDFSKKSLFLDRNAMDRIVEKYIEEPDDEYISMMNTMIQNANLTGVIIGFIEEKRKKEASAFCGTVEKWKKFRSNHWYFKYLTLWTATEPVNKQEYQELWDYPEYALSKSIEYGIWDMMDSYDNISEVISSVPFYRWQRAVENTCQIMDWKELQELNDKIQEISNGKDQFIWWSISYSKRYFREMDGTKSLADTDMSEIRELLQKYARDSVELFQGIYQKEVFEERSQMLPECCQIAFLLNDIYAEEEKQEYPIVVKLLKKIRDISVDFDIPVKYYLMDIEEQMKFKEQEQQTARDELHLMAQKILPKIEELMQMHRESEALAVVRQLRLMLPDDMEIAELEKKLQTQASLYYHF